MTQQWRSSTSDLLGKRGNACVFEFLRVYQTLRLRVEAEPNSSPTILRHMNGTARVESKGPRLYEPAFVCSACSHRHGIIGRWSVRRSFSDPADMAFYVTFAPDTTELKELAAVVGLRWTIEECFRSA